MYRQLTRFLFPLVLTALVFELSGQFLNGGMARVPNATETLASYGLAWGLVSLLTSPLSQVRQLGLVLVDSRVAQRKVQGFVAASGLLMAAVLAILALTPIGIWVIEDLHQAATSLSQAVRVALFWFIPIPLLKGLSLYYSGLLMRRRRTDTVSYAVLVSIGVSVLAVFGLLPTSMVQARPIWLPILVTYAGTLTELGVLAWGYRAQVHRTLPATGNPLRFSYVLRFFWPLALIMVIQGFSRPLINLFISREAGAAESLAVLTVVYSLAHVAYGWVNEIRNLAPAFREKEDALPHIFRFSLACGLLSFGLMVVLFWTPLRDVILGDLIAIEPGLVRLAQWPLIIFSFFPLTVMFRAYYHGIGLIEHRTQAMAPSAPSRLAAVLGMLLILPPLGVHGATRGVAALLAGFVLEALVVWWGVRGRLARLAPSRVA